MRNLFVGYWYKNYLDIYKKAPKKWELLSSSKLNELKPFKCLLGKKILVIGKDKILHCRKRYPHAPYKKLLKAIKLDLYNLFPSKTLEFIALPFEKTSTYVLFDIWAWENHEFLQIKKFFPFSYAIPEDLAFYFDTPEIKIYKNKDLIIFLAYIKGKYLATAIFKNSVSEEDFKKFFESLGIFKKEIKVIKIYGNILPKLNMNLEIIRYPEPIYPPFLEDIPKLNLSSFKVKSKITFDLKKFEYFLRFIIYFLLGYSFFLYNLNYNYKLAIEEIKSSIQSLKNLNNKNSQKRYSKIFEELKNEINAYPSPLYILDLIAEKLPEGSYLTHLIINGKQIEVSINTQDIFSVLINFEKTPYIKNIKLKNQPIKDTSSGYYRFDLSFELVK